MSKGAGSCRFLSTLLIASVFGGFHLGLLHASDLADLKARGKLVMLCSPHPQSEFIRRDGAGYRGLDYEILKTFAAAHDVSLEVRTVPEFADLIPWLLEGKGDVIASSFSITEERREKVDFSASYFPVRIMVVAKRHSTIVNAEDLSGLRAAVVPGSSLEAFILKKVSDVEIVPVSNTARVYDSIMAGEADYAPVDSSAAMGYLKKYPDVATLYSFPDTFGYGFAVSKGSDLQDALSKHIERLRSSGIYYKMIQRIFGSSALDLIKAAESHK